MTSPNFPFLSLGFCSPKVPYDFRRSNFGTELERLVHDSLLRFPFSFLQKQFQLVCSSGSIFKCPNFSIQMLVDNLPVVALVQVLHRGGGEGHKIKRASEYETFCRCLVLAAPNRNSLEKRKLAWFRSCNYMRLYMHVCI